MSLTKLVISLALLLLSSFVTANNSICYGTTKNGRLEYAVKLPDAGTNFIAYGISPELKNRKFVHSTVRAIIVSTYKELATFLPAARYKYAEAGFKNGGRFPPHKTHQNGLSVDFMVPVKDQNDLPSYFPTTKSNRYGYNVEFDNDGHYKNFRIDFEALAAHIVTLDKVSKKNGIRLWRVLFAPDLQDNLYTTSYGKYLKDNVIIPGKRSWVRHDEHYHVDFSINCK